VSRGHGSDKGKLHSKMGWGKDSRNALERKKVTKSGPTGYESGPIDWSDFIVVHKVR